MKALAVVILLAALLLVDATSIPLQCNGKLGAYNPHVKLRSMRDLERKLKEIFFVPANMILKDIKAETLEKLPDDFYSQLTVTQMRDLMESFVKTKQTTKATDALLPFHRALKLALAKREILREVTEDEIRRIGFNPEYIPVKALTKRQLSAFITEWTERKHLTLHVQTDLDRLPLKELVGNSSFKSVKLPERFFKFLSHVQPPVSWPKSLQQRAKKAGVSPDRLQQNNGVNLDEEENTLQNLQIQERNVLQNKIVRKNTTKRQKKSAKKVVVSSDEESSTAATDSDSETNTTSSLSESTDRKRDRRRRAKKLRRRKDTESDMSYSESEPSEDRRSSRRRQKSRRRNKPAVNRPGARTVLGRVNSFSLSGSE